MLRDLLIRAEILIAFGRHDDAALLLGSALIQADAASKKDIIALLEQAATASSAAACNLGLALMRGDGVQADPPRGARLLQNVADGEGTANRAFAHNFLGHYYCAAFDATLDLPRSLAHFETSGENGNAEAAFNAGVLLETSPIGNIRDVERAAKNYRRAARQGSASAMTKLASLIIRGEIDADSPHQAAGLLMTAADFGDDQASKIINLIEGEAKRGSLPISVASGIIQKTTL